MALNKHVNKGKDGMKQKPIKEGKDGMKQKPMKEGKNGMKQMSINMLETNAYKYA